MVNSDPHDETGPRNYLLRRAAGTAARTTPRVRGRKLIADPALLLSLAPSSSHPLFTSFLELTVITTAYQLPLCGVRERPQCRLSELL